MDKLNNLRKLNYNSILISLLISLFYNIVYKNLSYARIIVVAFVVYGIIEFLYYSREGFEDVEDCGCDNEYEIPEEPKRITPEEAEQRLKCPPQEKQGNVYIYERERNFGPSLCSVSNPHCKRVEIQTRKLHPICQALLDAGYNPSWTFQDLMKMSDTFYGNQRLQDIDVKFRLITKKHKLTNEYIKKCFANYAIPPTYKKEIILPPLNVIYKEMK